MLASSLLAPIMLVAIAAGQPITIIGTSVANALRGGSACSGRSELPAGSQARNPTLLPRSRRPGGGPSNRPALFRCLSLWMVGGIEVHEHHEHLVQLLVAWSRAIWRTARRRVSAASVAGEAGLSARHDVAATATPGCSGDQERRPTHCRPVSGRRRTSSGCCARSETAVAKR
jgi:hypothetical protein